MNLWKAVTISFLVHGGIMVLRPPQGVGALQGRDLPIEITYSIPKAPPKGIEHPVSAMGSPPGAPLDHPATPAPSLVGAPPPMEKKVEKKREEKLVPEKNEELPIPKKEVHLTEPEPPLSANVASNLPEGDFAAVEYKRLVRRHLKAHLTYPNPSLQGLVHLTLVLDPNGLVKEVSVVEASDPRLISATLEGVRSGEPYPHFPNQMKVSQAHYEFVVQYRSE